VSFAEQDRLMNRLTNLLIKTCVISMVNIRRTRVARKELAKGHTSPTRKRGTLPFTYPLLSVMVTSLVVSLAGASG